MFVLIGGVAVLKRLSAFAVISAFLALSVAQAVAQQTQQPQGPPWYGPGPWRWGDGYGWSFWWMCPMMMLIMLGVMAVVMLARRHRGHGGWTPPWQGSANSSLQILSERFARGEIQKEEYEEKKAAILSAISTS
jgi:putative membrane protein